MKTPSIRLLLLSSALCAGAPAVAEDVTIGILFGFTGPIESLTPPMADAAELAAREVSDSGLFLDGRKAVAVRVTAPAPTPPPPRPRRSAW
jgi:branched-chain amino acid transport system substrate-binding protein